RRAATLERVAGDLDDQRLELVEHWQRAAQVQDDWQRTHAAVVEHLESLAAAFPQREQALLTRQRALDGAEALLGERQQELSRLRQHLEGRAARLRLCERGWQSERQRLLAELRARDELAGKHWQKVVELRQRWAARRKQELEQLQADRAVCEQLRQEYATLRQEYWKRGLA